MVFQTRPENTHGGQNPLANGRASTPPSTSSESGNQLNSLDSLVDQITDAVQHKLIASGFALDNRLNKSVFSEPASPQSQNQHNESAQGVAQVLDLKQVMQLGVDRIGQAGDTPFQPHVGNPEQLAPMIDHTLLKPDATPDEIKRVCVEARDHGFATVCINSSYVGIAAELLKGSSTKPIAVVGFPLGAAASATKAFEARTAVQEGAAEIDMVINIGALKACDYNTVLEDIIHVVQASKPCPVKVILEMSNLDLEEKIIGCALSKAGGAAFVKTSTGFGKGGATVEDVRLMRKIVGPQMGVKASGGIRTYEDASKMVLAGANRIGASASVAIVTHQEGQKSDDDNPKTKNSLY